jgi:hypothetical protein
MSSDVQINMELISSYPNILKFAWYGISLSLTDADGIIPDPQDVLTAEMKEVLRTNRQAIISEVRNWESNNLTFLWASSTDFSSWVDADCRYGWEIGREPTYRILTADFYAYLRHRMTIAKRNYEARKIDSSLYEELRSRFNVIHDYAVRRFAESDLAESIRKMDAKKYEAPGDATITRYAEKLREIRRSRTSAVNPQVSKFQRQLSSRGFAVLKSGIDGVDIPIVISRNSLIPVNQLPRPYQSNAVQFTVKEALSLRSLGKCGVDRVLTDIINLRSVFPGSEIVTERAVQ